MKEYRVNGETRLWYEPSEIDAIMVSELCSARLLPNADDEDLSVDVERFVESHLGLPLDQYADLESHVLGLTEFRQGDKPKVSINKDLTGSALDEEDATPGLVGRWRATVAHETSHVLLHGYLYEIDSIQRGLFLSDPAPAQSQLLRCLKRDVGYRQQPSDWREVQANMGMGSLLMPKRVFMEAARQAMEQCGVSSEAIQSGSAEHSAIVDRLASRCSVSKQATRIRLFAFGVVHAADAPTL